MNAFLAVSAVAQPYLRGVMAGAGDRARGDDRRDLFQVQSAEADAGGAECFIQ
jgi:hypothetical protein